MLIFFAVGQSFTSPSWNFNFHQNFWFENLVWNSKALPKVKAFTRLVAKKSVNTNDMLQLRRLALQTS